jgi:hypothetical protein
MISFMKHSRPKLVEHQMPADGVFPFAVDQCPRRCIDPAVTRQRAIVEIDRSASGQCQGLLVGNDKIDDIE